jgi:hypothetical protein
MTEINNDTDRHLDEVLELHGALAVAILALRMIAGRNYPGEHNPERLAATAKGRPFRLCPKHAPVTNRSFKDQPHA